MRANWVSTKITIQTANAVPASRKVIPSRLRSSSQATPNANAIMDVREPVRNSRPLDSSNQGIVQRRGMASSPSIPTRA
ncbi:hypothetical protein GCM10025872_27170 [Barrientosiimonas endolithica]|uniref:Uncharacterized protein n=1 Tax=Barrientosiimonas endolithica TaxID=1535208 RepID=A0ABN6YSS9_9MICO|nr:hypothetical protein GCM10025872_27170 [Barrientosiimonas endolithica]